MVEVELLTLPAAAENAAFSTLLAEASWRLVIAFASLKNLSWNQLCNKNLKCKNSSEEALFHPHLFTEGAARAFEICSCHHTKRCQRLVGNLVYAGWVHICSVSFLM